MSASVWEPGSNVVNVDAESTNLSQVFTATAGQTLFTLTSYTYTLNSGALAVYRGGQRLIKGTDWAENTTSSFNITGITLAAGEVIEAVVVLGSASDASLAASASAAAALVSETNAAASAAAASGLITNHVAQADPHTQYALESSIGSTIQPYDAATAKTNVSQNFTVPQRSAILTDNDGSFDLSAKQNFKCTPSAGFTLTFTNQQDGLSGSVLLVNGANYAVALHANTKMHATDQAAISATGTYRIDYLSDGTNTYCTISRNLA